MIGDGADAAGFMTEQETSSKGMASVANRSIFITEQMVMRS